MHNKNNTQEQARKLLSEIRAGALDDVKCDGASYPRGVKKRSIGYPAQGKPCNSVPKNPCRLLNDLSLSSEIWDSSRPEYQQDTKSADYLAKKKVVNGLTRAH